MKKCPSCAEMIQDEAIKCRYCGSTLDEEQVKAISKHGPIGLKVIISSLLVVQVISIFWVNMKSVETDEEINARNMKSFHGWDESWTYTVRTGSMRDLLVKRVILSSIGALSSVMAIILLRKFKDDSDRKIGVVLGVLNILAGLLAAGDNSYFWESSFSVYKAHIPVVLFAIVFAIELMISNKGESKIQPEPPRVAL